MIVDEAIAQIVNLNQVYSDCQKNLPLSERYTAAGSKNNSQFKI